ncbi:hypothetical protein STVA_01670 [Allostella vacuolata]|nr:hypothetical protein STVA_01670 [Stella vacuolata]
MNRILGAAAVAAMTAAAPAQAAYVEIWNLMTANPYGAQLVVEDVRFADGGIEAPPRAVGQTLRLGDGTVTGFVLVSQTPTGGLAFALQCAPEASYGRVEIENPWTVSASGACRVVRRGTVTGNIIQWD